MTYVFLHIIYIYACTYTCNRDAMMNSSVPLMSSSPTVSSLGTGKSVTGAHIAYAFAMLNRQRREKPSSSGEKRPPLRCVLYCGPSNVAVDVIVSK